MKKDIKVLGIQFLTFIVVGFILEILFDMPEWFAIVIAGALFLFGGIYSIAASTGAAPCTVLSGKYKLVALLVFCIFGQVIC